MSFFFRQFADSIGEFKGLSEIGEAECAIKLRHAI